MKTIVNIYQNTIGAITHYCIREWTINIYAVERFVLENKLEDEQANVLSKPGVYILVNKDCVYIGQSQDILERWRQHLRSEKKDWFDCAYAITDVRDFSATDLNALEYLFFTKAKNAARFEIMNDQSVDNQKNDYLIDSNYYDTIFSNVNLLLNCIYRGHRVFDKIEERASSQLDDLQNHIFSMSKAECYGQLKKVKEGWLLLKGAQARKRDFEKTVSHPGTKKYIQYSIAYLEGLLDADLRTTEDILFSSPSTPITALAQQTANGWDDWKDENGNPLGKYRPE
ncbi:DUF4357 domain-containing protein [Candidatus Saccharibacteria bacterium]|nr:DUF4357 domain-containing protein [Candidatus Saccharibacteria bacterium]